ncbi:MAG: hypothetical protein HY216_05040 [Candidatus Rokubacteria bacterium]|nr:hypothetical protein [Candidatus Rokubacteria bacterium]
MKNLRVLTALVTLILVAGCASAPPRAVRSEFEDIPVPKGLAFLDAESTIIESPSVKAARLLYRGRIEPGSLATALRATLEANNWRHVSTAATAQQPATQVYEKSGNSLQVRVWEGLFYTYVEYTASRALQPLNKAQQQ